MRGEYPETDRVIALMIVVAAVGFVLIISALWIGLLPV
jgi:hypothetical protein